MGYTIRYSDLLSFKWALEGASAQLYEALSEIGESFLAFTGMQSFQGATADSMKSYISEVSCTIAAGFQVAMQELHDKYLFYKDGYGSIDNSVEFVLTEDKFFELINFYRNSEDGFDSENLTAVRAIDDVNDIAVFSKPRPYNVLSAYQQTLSDVNKLMVTTGEYETTQAATALNMFADIMGPLKALIGEYISKGGNTSHDYQSGDVVNFPYIQELGEALLASVENHNANAEELAAIGEREDARLKELEDIWAQERAEQGALNFLLGALVVVGGIACIVATAGMATPFVVAGAVAGMATIGYGLSNMVEAGYDMYYGFSGDYSTAAFNPLRDTIFQGNQEAYDTFGTVAIITSSVVTLGAGAVSAGSAAAKAGTSIFRAVGVYGAKTAVTAGAGMLGSWGSKELALTLGASDTVSDICGVVGGTVTGMAVGYGAQRLDRAYDLSGNTTPRISANGKSQIQINKEIGDAFETRVENVIRGTNTNVESQITIKVANGTVTRLDNVSLDSSGQIALHEAKSSATAGLTRNQRAAHPQLQRSGGVVIGKGKGIFTGGTIIPPTTIQIVRPNNIPFILPSFAPTAINASIFGALSGSEVTPTGGQYYGNR